MGMGMEVMGMVMGTRTCRHDSGGHTRGQCLGCFEVGEGEVGREAGRVEGRTRGYP